MRKNNKGQAAIEFLMTYGWMLLVVLIVGALIFSFVDFGSLLPNKIDLTNSFKGDAQRIVASQNDKNLQFVVRFVGSRANQIIAHKDNIKLKPVDAKLCTFESITNAAGDQVNGTSSIVNATTVSFVNGQESVITFDCDPSSSDNSGGATLIKSDIIEGIVTLRYTDPRTKTLSLVSSGNLRVSITD